MMDDTLDVQLIYEGAREYGMVSGVHRRLAFLKSSTNRRQAGCIRTHLLLFICHLGKSKQHPIYISNDPFDPTPLIQNSICAICHQCQRKRRHCSLLRD